MTTSNNPLHRFELGLGTWQWGDRLFWGYGQGYAEAELKEAFDASVAAGITFFDTAEVYGQGQAERFLARFIREARFQDGQKPYLATKFLPLPWRLTKGQFRRALQGSLRRLELDAVDLYQIHWPFPPVSIETWMDAMADAVEAGLVRAVGVSNYSSEQMIRAFTALRKRGVPLVSNQVPYSLLNRRNEHNGLLALCHELGVRFIAYSPLEQGLLTGKYTPRNPPPGIRSQRYRNLLVRIQPLITALREIGEAHGGKTPAQVALNWCICKGTLPIPGAKNAKQAEQNAGALGWRLTQEEVARLDRVSLEI
ncbi:MAG: aldo/keto reductase [Anaerolineales bacterium]|nr:aldo/keto reductase [Anaerolineales bacterium]